MSAQMAKDLSTTVFARIISWIVSLVTKFICLFEGMFICFTIICILCCVDMRISNMYLFSSAPNFHLPQDLSVPLILIGPGTGIAPFRGFWHHRRTQLTSRNRSNAGPVWLFFGCRTKNMDLYREEKEQAKKEGVLSKVFLALSREKNIPKVSKL